MISRYEIKKVNYWLAGILVLSLIGAAVTNILMIASVESKLAKISKKYMKINDKCREIYRLDPARAANAANMISGKEFHYSNAVSEIAARWKIPTSNYEIRTEGIQNSKGRITQGARMTITDVSIADAAKFLSQFLNDWPNLKCESIKLTSDKESKDTWKVTLDFEYNMS